MNGESDVALCPCEVFEHPRVIDNPPGLDAVGYRVGDYAAFRQALLIGTAEERELAEWHPAAGGDLALQIVEWWAYLADVLTFYSERVVNESYLRTAQGPGALERLVRLLGHRPRPAIAARGVLGAVFTGKATATLPAGLAFQSNPPPGDEPQVFELDAATELHPGGVLPALIAADKAVQGKTSLLLAGKISSLAAGQFLLLAKRDAGSANSAWLKVSSVAFVKDAAGKSNTRVTFTAAISVGVSGSADDVANFQLLRSDRSTPLCLLPAVGTPITSTTLHLASLARDIEAGQLVAVQWSTTTQVRKVSSYGEVIWYANTDDDDPEVAPAENAIAILHTELGLNPALTSPPSSLKANVAVAKAAPDPFDDLSPSEADLPDAGDIVVGGGGPSVVVRYGFRAVGELIPVPADKIAVSPALLGLPIASVLPSGSPVLIQDKSGTGVDAELVGSSQASAELAPDGELVAPLSLFDNLLPISRGKSVPSEVLGSGDARIASQSFALKKSPLSYFAATDPNATADYTSTLVVRVNGVAWQEVPSFFDQPADAEIFVTYEDEEQLTHVVFGDGVNGARLPSGSSNVVASYRFGAGKKSPPAGSITAILTPYPGLGAVKNPVAVGGGDDAEPATQLRRYAPRSVLALGRAVSLDDFEAVAAGAPAVTRAQAYFVWDGAEQRGLVKVFVGDTSEAVDSAKAALALAADPNRFWAVEPAVEVDVTLSLSVAFDSRYVLADVQAAVESALLDPDRGLFGANVRGIGSAVYESQIHEACLRQAGTLAVRELAFVTSDPNVQHDGARHAPGVGRVFVLAADGLLLSLSPEAIDAA